MTWLRRLFAYLFGLRDNSPEPVVAPIPRQIVIGRMTNWQNTQWARAGYPTDRIEEFAETKHWKSQC